MLKVITLDLINKMPKETLHNSRSNTYIMLIVTPITLDLIHIMPKELSHCFILIQVVQKELQLKGNVCL